MKNLIFNTTVLIFTLNIVFGCSYTNKYAKRVFKDRVFIAKEFLNYSIIRSRSKNTVILDIYKSKLKNRFFFQKGKENEYVASKDSIEYDKEHFNDKTVYGKELISFLKKKIQIMDDYDIRDVSCEFRNQGIDMKIYFNSLDVLLYVSDSKAIKNEEWMKYLKGLKKLNENWYYEYN
jgi:hypothetical protein